jgi:hypothetical protein
MPMLIHRLTVDGRDYFLPDPVTELRGLILEAVRAGGGYVTIPPINGGAGVEILFSPGMPVLWAQLAMSDDRSDVATERTHNTENSHIDTL